MMLLYKVPWMLLHMKVWCYFIWKYDATL